MDADQLHRIGKALADPRRLEILEHIAGSGEIACAKLCSQFPVSQATMSHHLKELANAGLVKARREAKFQFYRFERQTWAKYLTEMRKRIPVRSRKA